ncbi:hypothetical protein K4K51_000857 [Colletotrichum sp. SAR 10_75]|nr:hypothetical protein K4K51_000857 [Colletotrichum sp. SAR 10_75]
MDNTPLHPAITTLAPDPSGTRHGAFLAAIPHNRSMYRTTLCLRIASLLLALVILGGVLGSMHETDDMYVSNWAMGSPTSALAMLWSGGDLMALVVRDRGVRWTKSKDRPRNARGRTMPPAYDMFGAERKQRRPTGLYRNNGTLAEAFKFNDGDSARRKLAGRQIVKNRLRVFETSPEIHEGQGESRQAIGSFAGMRSCTSAAQDDYTVR